MKKLGRALGAAILSLSAVLAGAGAPTASAATGTAYVALGDSYSSGLGGGSHLSDGTSCSRSLAGYPGVNAATFGLSLNLQACAGAVVSDVQGRQLGALSAATNHVTITVGGNDVGFASVLTTCAQPGWMGNCNTAIDNALTIATRDLPGRLDALYAAIRARAPHARVVVAGYPRLFNGRDCHVLTFFSTDEMARLNAAATTLNGVIAAATGRAGFAYADVTGAFSGHAVCDGNAWIHNLTVPVANSYHPNASGYRYGYAPPVAAGMRVSAAATPTRVVTGGQTSSDTGRGTVSAPDLTTTSAREAARRAGITPAELDALVAAQLDGATNDTLEAMSEAAAG